MGSQLFTFGVIIVIAAVALGTMAATFRRQGSDVTAPFSQLDDLDVLASQAHLWSGLSTGDDGPLSPAERLAMVSRLESVGEKWCVDALREAGVDDSDPEVKSAAHDALSRLSAGNRG
jgi:hypothetical protein